MPKVYNKHHGDAPADAVYIGRPTIYGNPFSHLPGAKAEFKGTREEAIQAYANYLEHKPDLVALIKKNLKGKDLVCFCSPKSCHGDLLLRIANEE